MSRYHIVPRDSDEETSSTDSLLPTSIIDRRNAASRTCGVDINAVILLRIISIALGVTSFVFWVLDGRGNDFIASDVFMMPLIILNVLQVVNHILTVILKVTINVQRRSRQVTLGHPSKNKRRVAMYFDIGLALILLITIPIGHASSRGYYYSDNGLSTAGAIIGYFVIAIQLLLAVPQLANKKLTLKIQFSPLNEERDYEPERDVEANSAVMQGSRAEFQKENLPRPSTDTLV